MSVESPIFAQMRQEQQEQESQFEITLESGLFLFLALIIFLIRAYNVNYNTLFLDEAINAVIGEDLLAGVYDRGAMAFHFGSYLYPALAATVDQIGGVTALRIASALTSTIAAVFIYLSTRPIFGRNSALFAMLLFGFSGAAVNMGQLAVYDSLAIPFLAVSLYLLVTAARFPDQENKYLVAASAGFILAALSKYIGLIYLPALVVTGLALFFQHGRPLWPAVRAFATYFILPAAVTLGSYGLYYLEELRQVASQQGYSWAARNTILGVIWQEVGLLLLLALAGLGLTIVAYRSGRIEATGWIGLQGWFRQRLGGKITLLLTALFVVALLLTWLAAPAYHLLGQNMRSLWKNSVYSLIFLAPLAGYAVARAIEWSRSRDTFGTLMGLAITIMAAILFIDRALDSNAYFQTSWPDVTNSLSHLRQAGVGKSSRVLAESMDVYEYYFDFGTADRAVWHNVWYMEYEDLTGQEAVLAAVGDGYFDFIVLEDYYAPGIRQLLDPLLVEAGYVLDFEEVQKMAAGERVLIQIFALED
jgi:4-amino-4-deoxy-L-arabinose transferase-like glycosyltransferase